MTTDKALAERLIEASDQERWYGIRNLLREAAALTREPSTPSAQAGEVVAYIYQERYGHDSVWIERINRTPLPPWETRNVQPLYTTPQPQGDAGPDDGWRDRYLRLCDAFDRYAEPWMRDDGDGGYAGTLKRMAEAAATPQARPDGGEAAGRDAALKLARAAAYASHHTHDYLPRTAEDAHNWQPHEWVLDAIQAAALDAGTHPTPAPDTGAELREQIAEGKAQWDRVAKAIGADGDDVDDVFAKADAVARLVEVARQELVRRSLTSLPLKLELGKKRGMTLDEVHTWMAKTYDDLPEALAPFTAAQQEGES